MTREQIHSLVDMVLDVQEQTSAYADIDISNHGGLVNVYVMDQGFDAARRYDGHYNFVGDMDVWAENENKKAYKKCTAHLDRLMQGKRKDGKTYAGVHRQQGNEADMLLVSQKRVQDLKREIAEMEAQDYMEAVMWCTYCLKKLELWTE
ncbi:hypothetical protein [Murimonas intestini]|uniref:Uncharacterized protein n=1 Tax=Murimonas intestini TaxID=1337051 RepID=A0AB73SZJ0_9FIRM|nr:hypothetical protein [Murimonas intestini]MCR1842788.1 hypothetical protein [Murimonas intestini]MCR1867873.1 hypothetical protein [Murimonas intestini]MCR1885224.1 hypothetical protein [Murimonas intestini]